MKRDNALDIIAYHTRNKRYYAHKPTCVRPRPICGACYILYERIRPTVHARYGLCPVHAFLCGALQSDDAASVPTDAPSPPPASSISTVSTVSTVSTTPASPSLSPSPRPTGVRVS